MEKAVQMKTKRRVLASDKPPTGVHHIGFNRVGGEVVMDVAFFDMAELVKKLDEVKKREFESVEDIVELEVEVAVFAQYSMSADTFVRLRENVEHIYSTMKESGHVVPKAQEDQENENSGSKSD